MATEWMGNSDVGKKKKEKKKRDVLSVLFISFLTTSIREGVVVFLAPSCFFSLGPARRTVCPSSVWRFFPGESGDVGWDDASSIPLSSVAPASLCLFVVLLGIHCLFQERFFCFFCGRVRWPVPRG